MAVAAADERPAARADAPADERAGVRRRVVGIDEAVRLELLGELEHVDPRLHGDRSVLEVDLEDPVHELHVDHDPVPQRHGPVGQPGAARARDDGDALAVGELHDLGDLLRRGRQDDGLGDELLPAVGRERRRDPRAVEERRAAGEDVLLAADRDELVDQGVGRARSPSQTSNPAASATSSKMSKTSIPCSLPCSSSGRSDQGQAETSVSTPSRARRPRPAAG